MRANGTALVRSGSTGTRILREEALRVLFGGLEPGEFYSQTTVTKAIGYARDLYGSRGYTGLTIYPDLQRRTAPELAVSGDPAGDANGDNGDNGGGEGGQEKPLCPSAEADAPGGRPGR